MQKSIKGFVRELLPYKCRKNLQAAYFAISSYKYFGDAYECPFCNKTYSKFLPYGNRNKVFIEKQIIGGYRENCICPRCHSTDRERLIYLYLKENTQIFGHRCKVLHIAPERNLRKVFKKEKYMAYFTGDLYPELYHADAKIDLTDIDFEDNSFDYIIANHVLEHIPEDIKAIKEVFRVLKPNGLAILQVPISHILNETYEDRNITSWNDRENAYGQGDHVRLYGLDYPSRLQDIGFHIEKYNWVSQKGKELTCKLGLIALEDVYACKKCVN